MSKMDNLKDLYEHLLKDAYSAEKQLTEALPKVAEAAKSPDLRKAFTHHLQETHQHFSAIGNILNSMGINPGNKVCVAMEGLIEEGKESLEKRSQFDPDVLDASLITAAQKVEHYEISQYGTLREYATVLEHHDHAEAFQRILDQEYEADKTLTAIAEGGLNVKALAA
jgi:ferritin-like metal-binding protein YciE